MIFLNLNIIYICAFKSPIGKTTFRLSSTMTITFIMIFTFRGQSMRLCLMMLGNIYIRLTTAANQDTITCSVYLDSILKSLPPIIYLNWNKIVSLKISWSHLELDQNKFINNWYNYIKISNFVEKSPSLLELLFFLQTWVIFIFQLKKSYCSL